MFKFKTRCLEVLPPTWESQESRRAVRSRMSAYGVVILLFFLMIIAAWLRPDFNRPEPADWKPVLARADAAWERGDRYQARHLYLQVDRIASWNRDWEDLVAAACRFRRLDGVPTPYSKVYTLLIRATVVAEQKKSRQAMATIAEAFSMMGQHQAASLFLARIGSNWPAEHTDPVKFC
jgi:hypothetical protein